MLSSDLTRQSMRNTIPDHLSPNRSQAASITRSMHLQLSSMEKHRQGASYSLLLRRSSVQRRNLKHACVGLLTSPLKSLHLRGKCKSVSRAVSALPKSASLEKQLCRAAVAQRIAPHNTSAPVDILHRSINYNAQRVLNRASTNLSTLAYHKVLSIFIALSLGRRPGVSDEKAGQALPMFQCHQKPPD
jgi:hypothetical protein